MTMWEGPSNMPSVTTERLIMSDIFVLFVFLVLVPNLTLGLDFIFLILFSSASQCFFTNICTSGYNLPAALMLMSSDSAWPSMLSLIGEAET